MRRRKIALLAGTAAASAAASLALILPAPAAQATTDPGHVILKAGGGTIALATTGRAGSVVYAGKYRASNPAEDWGEDHEPGGGLPGGRFGLYWAPSRQTDLYVVATPAGASLLNSAVASTVFSGWPKAAGGYTALSTLVNGGTVTKQELTYLGNGKIALRPEGAHGPTANQLWKVTG